MKVSQRGATLSPVRNKATSGSRLQLRPEQLGRLTFDAAVLRYRFMGLRGAAFLFVSVFDIVLYAAAIYLVVSTVFAQTGFERFGLSLLGLLAFRWSLSCAIQASRVAHFCAIAQPMQRCPVAATTIVALAAPTLNFLVSAVLLITFLAFTSDGSAGLGHVVVWGALVMAVHLIWNIVLVLAVTYVRLRKVIMSETPIIMLFGLVFIVSPVAFQFTDIPEVASRLFTSFNPLAHLIAGYQNAWWYGEAVSLQVLPASLLLCLLMGAVLVILVRRDLGRTLQTRLDETSGVHSCFQWNGRDWLPVQVSTLPEQAAWFSRWNGEIPWLTGAAVVHFLRPDGADQLPVVPLLEFLTPGSASAILDTPLPVMSERARDRICTLVAMRENTCPVVLDGLMDSSSSEDAKRFLEAVQEFRRESCSIYVIVDNEQVRAVFERAILCMTDAEVLHGLRNA